VTDRSAFDFNGTLGQAGPLSRDQAAAALEHAAELMRTADFQDAARLYHRVVGVNDAALTAAAFIGLGEACERMNDEPRALANWESATGVSDNEYTYTAWRNVAAARVRLGDLQGAVNAYREADRRAPREDKAEIAGRLGWLSKELGDKGASGKYFARARGDVGFSFALGVIAVTVIVSLVADFLPADTVDLFAILQLDKVALAAGEIWRLWTASLLHAPLLQNPLHLVFNMYAIWLAGPFIERLYGRSFFLVAYLVTVAGGSLGSFAFGDAQWSIGASGGVFGLFGLLIAAQYVHRPLLDRGSRAFLGQLVALVILNFILGLTTGTTDNWAHAGGLVSGLWLGVLFAPTGVPTIRSMWMRPGPTPGTTVPAFGASGTMVVRMVGVVALLAFFVLLWANGMATWG